VKARVMVVTMALAMALSGCALLSGRREFAHRAASGAEPILSEYRGYVDSDSKLDVDAKRMRQRLVDEFEAYLKEGSQ